MQLGALKNDRHLGAYTKCRQFSQCSLLDNGVVVVSRCKQLLSAYMESYLQLFNTTELDLLF